MTEVHIEFFCTECSRSTLEGDKVTADYCSECGGEVNFRCTGIALNSRDRDELKAECGKEFTEYREQRYCDRCGNKLYWG